MMQIPLGRIDVSQLLQLERPGIYSRADGQLPDEPRGPRGRRDPFDNFLLQTFCLFEAASLNFYLAIFGVLCKAPFFICGLCTNVSFLY